MAGIYFLLENHPIDYDGAEYVKIGKTELLVEERIAGLQTGNPRPLFQINFLTCTYNQLSREEVKAHNHFRAYRVAHNTEWFKNIPLDMIEEYVKRSNDTLNFKSANSIKIARLNFDGEFIIGEDQYPIKPKCYFYPERDAGTMREVGPKIIFRTKEWPTYGKHMILPQSTALNRVFISNKKSDEDREERKYYDKIKTQYRRNDYVDKNATNRLEL